MAIEIVIDRTKLVWIVVPVGPDERRKTEKDSNARSLLRSSQFRVLIGRYEVVGR